MNFSAIKSKLKNKRTLSIIIGIVIVCVVVSLSLTSTRKEKKSYISSFDDPKAIPSLSTFDVNTLISDSGVTRYRIKAKEWRVYDKADEPYWYFPQGIFVEKFDSLFETESFILSDTATFYNKKQLWRLRGNVRIENTQDEKFFTEELYWSQQKKSIYSDSAIHIERTDRIIEGMGFTSNEAMTRYKIRHTTGIFPIEQQKSASGENKDQSKAAQKRSNNAQKYAPGK
ncbi:MAG: LPS export ABC transporter periplasmic protein LptC [Coprobacter sp.]|nr:LPS export ABC transporter periplasmic protein LptC [Coprobacter sp.]